MSVKSPGSMPKVMPFVSLDPTDIVVGVASNVVDWFEELTGVSAMASPPFGAWTNAEDRH
jgi:hypothetical protein